MQADDQQADISCTGQASNYATVELSEATVAGDGR
jgi:hypothetical protein